MPTFAVFKTIASDCSVVIPVFAVLLVMSEACCLVMPTFNVFAATAILFETAASV